MFHYLYGFLSCNSIVQAVVHDYIYQQTLTFQALINGLYTDENNQKLNIGRAVKSIAIDPFHYKPGLGRKFIIGKYICVDENDENRK